MAVASPVISNDSDASAVVAALQREIFSLESARRDAECGIISSGFGALDRALPHGGFREGSLVEWLSAFPGDGTDYLALTTVANACRNGGACVVLDDAKIPFYPPAFVKAGIPEERLVLVRPESQSDRIWAIEQALRSVDVSAVIAPLAQIDDRDFRRLQLAAEPGRAIGLLLRSDQARRQATWADVRMQVRASPTDGSGRCLEVHVVGGKGVTKESCVQVRLADDTNPLYPVA